MTEPKKFQIKIDSILGGQSPTTHFAAPDQFRASLGIDPALPINDDTESIYGVVASGLLRPTSSYDITSAGLDSKSPLWMIPTPKYGEANSIYVYVTDNIRSSLYAVNMTSLSCTNIADGGGLANSKANGAAYYDNYVYLAKNTTIARYGPLDGTRELNGDYWATTLSKTPLSDIPYPLDLKCRKYYPNHVMLRHSDGRLYIADVQGNQGVLHYIQTTKTTVEGDTDNGSTFGKLYFGYGLYPTALESYGSNIVIALMETSDQNVKPNNRGMRAKLGFWDTTSQNVNQITWVEFPDQIITALKNVNGVLYIVSGVFSLPS